MQLQSGTLLQEGKYKIEKTLGQGGFGITYLGTQVGLNRLVAIKEFFMKEYCERDEQTSKVFLGSQGSKEIVERFRVKFIKEAQIIAQFDHPHIIHIHDIFEENFTAYYVMEYVDGEPLDTLVKLNGKLDEVTTLSYIHQIAAALAYIHQRKILHLDIKPSNILIRHGNRVVLIDFGISKRYDENGSQTSTTPAGISKGYAPIEQYRQGGIDIFAPCTDIYSLAATMYKLLSGETPPEASVIIDEGLTIPSIICKKFANAIEVSMNPARKRRPQTIADFLSLITNEDCQPTEVIANDFSEEETIMQSEINHHYTTIDVNGIVFEMCFIEGGTFTMGGTSEQLPDAYSDETKMKISIHSFYLAKTVVTQKQWDAVMNSKKSACKDENLPVQNVSWLDCVRFIQELNRVTGFYFRIPNEEEWEYAARGGNVSKGYKYAGSNNIDEVAWYDKNSGNQPHPVALKRGNELGLYDMCGNIQEWCSSFYENGSDRVIRGGCFLSSPRRCRVSCRNHNAQVYSDSTISFRLALDNP